ncbi:MAG: FAD-binding oxidoreductase [Nitrosotalea sp.]
MLEGKIGKRLARLVDCKVTWDDQILDLYSVDASSYILKPSVVAFPRNENDIIKILRYASKNKIPVTARGGGTGLVGAALGSGIILDMKHLERIKIGPDNVEVDSGVSKGRLDRELKKHGRFLGPDPSIGPFCTIGGMVATNASGSHSLKYGSMIDNLLQVKIITSYGKLITLPNKDNIGKKIIKLIKPQIQKSFPLVSKNSCGYRIDKIKSEKDIQKIITASEGTLGIIVSAKLKTIPIPKKVVLITISYKTIKQAVLDVTKIVKLEPSALEIIDNNIVQHIKTKIPKDTHCMLFVEFDENLVKNIISIKNISSGKIIKIITKRQEISQWWSFRNSALSYSLRSISKQETVPSLIEDATVPVEKLPLLLDLAENLASKHDMKMVIYGHAGNGNLHIRPVLKKKDKRLIKKIAKEFFSGVILLGGCITGEHGDGLARTEFVKLQYGDETYSLFKKIKHIFDPTNILNPGKIISQGSTVTRNLKI